LLNTWYLRTEVDAIFAKHTLTTALILNYYNKIEINSLLSTYYPKIEADVVFANFALTPDLV
jgi:hypothetical protein